MSTVVQDLHTQESGYTPKGGVNCTDIYTSAAQGKLTYVISCPNPNCSWVGVTAGNTSINCPNCKTPIYY